MYRINKVSDIYNDEFLGEFFSDVKTSLKIEDIKELKINQLFENQFKTNDKTRSSTQLEERLNILYSQYIKFKIDVLKPIMRIDISPAKGMFKFNNKTYYLVDLFATNDKWQKITYIVATHDEHMNFVYEVLDVERCEINP